VVPLLEVGAGFHPELSGRENVFLNGAILGFTRAEMESKLKEVMNFSELGTFFDSPMRTYSSGMWARLGFAVATVEQPDVLIVDEVLAVGDEEFQRKCLDRINKFREQGTTIFIVTHAMSTILSMCQRVVWLDHGEIQTVGEPEMVVGKYRESQRELEV
jgi:ABC-type polysaccharide/polyol phosphate transport system ATPase subunit